MAIVAATAGLGLAQGHGRSPVQGEDEEETEAGTEEPLEATVDADDAAAALLYERRVPPALRGRPEAPGDTAALHRETQIKQK